MSTSRIQAIIILLLVVLFDNHLLKLLDAEYGSPIDMYSSMSDMAVPICSVQILSECVFSYDVLMSTLNPHSHLLYSTQALKKSFDMY